MNIKTEDFGFEAKKYNEKMIVLAPQLEDWGEKSANQAIDLTEYIIKRYNIDKRKVYLSGYSGGGETGSIIMGKNPQLFTAYLHCSSQWDGDYEVFSNSRVPVYMVIGENDEYYGSKKTKMTYKTLYDLYRQKGLSEEEINSILVLDVKSKEYFSLNKVTNQHGGGSYLFSHDEKIMGWLFDK